MVRQRIHRGISVQPIRRAPLKAACRRRMQHRRRQRSVATDPRKQLHATLLASLPAWSRSKPCQTPPYPTATAYFWLKCRGPAAALGLEGAACPRPARLYCRVGQYQQARAMCCSSCALAPAVARSLASTTRAGQTACKGDQWEGSRLHVPHMAGQAAVQCTARRSPIQLQSPAGTHLARSGIGRNDQFPQLF